MLLSFVVRPKGYFASLEGFFGLPAQSEPLACIWGLVLCLWVSCFAGLFLLS